MKLAESKLRRIISSEIKSVLSEKNYSLRFLLEENDSVAKSSEKKSVNWETGYESFITALKRNVTSRKVKAFIAAGKLDGNPNDDKFKFSQTSVNVSDLIPMQNEIDTKSALRYSLKNPDKFQMYVKSTGPFSPGDKPIVIFNDKYIIDGHHRWAELYCCNKDASIECINAQIGGLEPLDILKAVQAAIIVQSGEVRTETVDGINLLTIDDQSLDSYLDKNITDQFVIAIENDLDVLEKINASDDTLQSIKDHIVSNVEQMKNMSQPIAGAPTRGFMPQTSNINWEKPLAAGIIDIVAPHASNDALEKVAENKITKNQSIILERWHKIAGLIS